jgi:peroxiredoxin Q/BCP
MKRLVALGLVAGALALGAPATAGAQQASGFLPVGTMAPDIEVVGATRYGYLRDPVKLSDFRGQTVVLAFFFRARTPG